MKRQRRLTTGLIVILAVVWSTILNSAFAEQPPARTPQDITFRATIDDTDQKYVLVEPNDFDPAQPTTLMIALHGHGSDRWQFIQQDRDECRAVRDIATRHRMLLVSPDYRARTSWMGPKAEADMVQIITSLRQKYRINRVLVVGASMGGASCLTFAVRQPQLVDGVVSMNGTANHLEYDNFQAAIQDSFGGNKTDARDEYVNRSAELHPEKLTMPVAFTVGGRDTSVPPQSVLRLAARLQQADRKTLLLHRPDGGHSTNYQDAIQALEFVVQTMPSE